jgi:hypothetical protein
VKDGASLLDAPIVAAADDAALMDQHGANRNAALVSTAHRFFDRRIQEDIHATDCASLRVLPQTGGNAAFRPRPFRPARLPRREPGGASFLVARFLAELFPFLCPAFMIIAIVAARRIIG